jgi:hypothetical protein
MKTIMQMGAVPFGAALFSSVRSLLFVRQLLAEQTPQSNRLRALQVILMRVSLSRTLAARKPSNVRKSPVEPSAACPK